MRTVLQSCLLVLLFWGGLVLGDILEGDLGLTVGTKWDLDNRIIIGHSHFYHIRDHDGTLIPLTNTSSEMKNIPLSSVVQIEGTFSNKTNGRFAGNVKRWEQPESKRQAGFNMPAKFIGLGEINVLFFAMSAGGSTSYAWTADPPDLPGIFERLRQHFLRNSYGQLNLVSRKRDGSFGYYGILPDPAPGACDQSTLTWMESYTKMKLGDDVWWNGNTMRVILWTPAFTKLCGSTAWGTIGHPGTIWSEPTDYILSHEMGHNVGMMHAGVPSGVNAEYGDCSDPMGCLWNEVPLDLKNGGVHHNAPHKVLVGWMRDQPSRIATFASPITGHYKLVPLSWADNAGQLQVIGLGSASTFTSMFASLSSTFISFRWVDNSTGIEDNFKAANYQGINVHRQVDQNGRSFFISCAKTAGAILDLQFPDLGVKITVTSMSSTGAEIDMIYASITPGTPAGGVHSITAPLQFFTIPPWRLVDSRTNYGPPFKAGEIRTYNLYDTINVPTTAVSFAAGISALLGSTGYLTLWPACAPQPFASSINFQTGLYLMGSVYTSVALDGRFRIYANAESHVVLDITGYFAPASAPGVLPRGLWYNPVTPFRVFDTRTMAAGPISTTRAMPFRGVGAIAQTAKAVSFTAAMVDAFGSDYVTAWGEGNKPFVATGLYNKDIYGELAGISGIGADGSVRFFSPQPIQIVADADGYFDPSSGLGFLPTATPSRILDTRETSYHGNGEYSFNVAGVTCPGGVTIPTNAKVLVCTAAAISQGITGFVTLWPSGAPQPLAAQLQLNVKQQVMALALNVPIGSNGQISIYMNQPGDIAIDVVGYYVESNAPAAADLNLIGLYSLFPIQNSDIYLGAIDSVVPFRALAGPLWINSVEFRLNGQRLGSAQPCADGNGWCFDVNFKTIDGPALIEAVSDRGASVEFEVPLLRPMWMAPYLSQLHIDSPASFSGSFNMPWMTQSGRASFDIPPLGLQHSWSTQFSTTVNLNHAGVFYITGSGSRTDTFTTPSGTFSGNFATKFTATSGLDKTNPMVQIPTVLTAQVTHTGELPMPSLWKFDEDVNLFGFQFHVVGNVDAKASAGLTVNYVASSSQTDLFFGLPIRQDTVTGNALQLETTIAGRIDAGPITTSFAANLSLTPQISWSQAAGLTWTGLQTSSNMAINLDLWHLRTRVAIANTNGVVTPKRGTINALDVSSTVPLENIWSPTLLNGTSPFILDNVYPSAMTGIASARGTDVMVWSSFDTSKAYPNNVQVQFAFRRAGGNWSVPAFVPGLPASPVGTPVLEDIETTGDIILVVSEVQNPSAPIAQLQTRLLYSVFNPTSGSWGAFVPLFPAAAGPVTEWLPRFSEVGLWIGFVRYSHASGVGQLLTSRYTPGTGFSDVEVVISDSSTVSGFNLDTDPNGNGVLVYRSAVTSKLNVCLRAAGSAGWQCNESAIFATADPSTVPTVLYTREAFLLVWANGSTIYTAKISVTGAVLHQHSNVTSALVQGAAGTTCAVLGNGSVALGWNSWNAQGGFFQYAVADPDGALYFSTSTVAPNIYPTSFSSATQVAWTGKTLLYMTISRSTAVDGQPRGTLTAQDLSFDPVVVLGDIQFSPADFSQPLVTVSITLTNAGLLPLPAGGVVNFRLDTDAAISVPIGTFGHSAALTSGQTVKASVIWDTSINASTGGVVEVYYIGSAGDVSQKSVRADPCLITLANAVITDAPAEFGVPNAVSVLLSVYGPGSGVVVLSAWTRASDGTTPDVGQWNYTMTPNMRQTVFIPVSDDTLVINEVTIRAQALTARASLSSTAYDDRFDFSIRMDRITVTPGAVTTGNSGYAQGAFVLSFPVANGGTLAAWITVSAYLVDSAGIRVQLASTQTSVDARSESIVQLTIILTNAQNLIELVVNGDDTPELITASNKAQLTVLFAQSNVPTIAPTIIATPSATPTPPTASSTVKGTGTPSASTTSKKERKWLIPTIVAVVIASLIVIALTAFAAYRLLLNNRGSSKSNKNGYASLLTQTDNNNL